jgi:hypothetical protein
MRRPPLPTAATSPRHPPRQRQAQPPQAPAGDGPYIALLDAPPFAMRVAEEHPDSAASWLFAAADAVGRHDGGALTRCRRELLRLGWVLRFDPSI